MPPNSSSTKCIDCGKTHPPRTALIPSPFQSIIALETFPTPLETAAMREFTRGTDAEIVWREQAIERLICEVAELRRRSEQHKFIVAPIRRVPREILAEIFLQLATMEEDGGKPDYYHLYGRGESLFEKKYMGRPLLHRAPLIFGEVSRAWRTVSLSTPRLWSSISLRCGNKQSQTNSALCATWLKRAGSLPLSIRFSRTGHFELAALGEPVSPAVVRNCQDLMKAILPYSRRWRFLHFQNLPPSSYDIIDSLQPGSVPILEYLSVENIAGPRHSIPQSTPWAKLKVAPKLTHLFFDKFRGSSIVIQGEGRTFPFSQLTHIDVNGCSGHDCLAILSQAPRAVACQFTMTETSSLQHPSVLHPGLQTLKFNLYVNPGQFSLSQLTCSALSTLSICAEREASPFSQDLPAFISRSGSTLTDLVLDGCSLDDHRFIALLRSLDVSDYTEFTDRVWDSLTRKVEGSSPALLPLLESIKLRAESSHKSVVRMLKSRLQTPTSHPDLVSLKKLILTYFFCKPSQSAYDQLLGFRKLGLDIQINVHADSDDETGSEASDSQQDRAADNEDPMEESSND